MQRTAVVMPAYNEAAGIADFVEEVLDSVEGDVVVIVCDDCSTDSTIEKLQELTARGLSVRAEPGVENAGHGPTTTRALRSGLASGADVIVAVDGDGHFAGSDIAALAERARAGVDVVEGVRRDRVEPKFRAVASMVTRVLVWTRTRRMPLDANTPLRAYCAPALEELLKQLPESALTPNLVISARVRRGGFTYEERPVRWRPRRGAAGSTTFGAERRLPSRRFTSFCWRAGCEWLAGSR